MRPRCGGRGFTLLETIIAIGLLALVSVTVARLQPRIYEAQNSARDEREALEVQRSCAERLVMLRRNRGFDEVKTDSCVVLAPSTSGSVRVGAGNFTPFIALSPSPCSGSVCTATVTARRNGSAVALPALTIQFSAY